MTPDHATDPRLAPDHAHDEGAALGLLPDERCYWCTGELPPRPLPGWLEAGLDRVAGTEAGS